MKHEIILDKDEIEEILKKYLSDKGYESSKFLLQNDYDFKSYNIRAEVDQK